MEEEQKTTNILVIWRGQKFNVEANPGVTLKEFGQKLQQLTNVKSDTIRLLVPRSHDNGSKLLSPFSDEHSSLSLQESSLLEGKSVRMMGVFEDEIEEVSRNITKADMRIAGFDEEERRLRQRMLSGPKTPLKLPQGAYVFCDFHTLHIPGIELHPPASEALRRMHMLAADPGIVAIMNKHRWRVGIMTEMAPVGYVGDSPKCILGFNKNHGEEISLRLRTDDLKGFRKYESIKKTLLHELAHMVYSEHDANFFALDSQLNKEAANLDWTKSRSHTLSGLRPSDYFEEEYDIETGSSVSQKLGGHTSDQLATARASSVAAAYRRLADASAKHEIHAEPDPDDYERLPDHSILKENLQVEHPREAYKFQNQNGSLGDEAMDVETYSGINGGGITAEPDPDDSEMAESASHSRTNRLSFGAKICAEPDPDDCKANHVTVKNRMAESDPDDSVISKKANGKARVRGFDEPDLDDSQAADIGKSTAKVNKTKEEPDPDESSMEIAILGCESNTEPDPDDSIKGSVEPYNGQNDEPSSDDPELRRIQDPVAVVCTRLQKAIDMLKSEVNPMEATSVLQTLFKIIRNVIEHPNEAKFKRLRKANPQFQRNVANYKAAIEVLHLVGFNEDTVSDEIGRSETYMVLKRNDPGLLWLAKSSLEMCIAY